MNRNIYLVSIAKLARLAISQREAKSKLQIVRHHLDEGPNGLFLNSEKITGALKVSA